MNNIIRSQGGMPVVGQRDGNWIWDGSNWICDPDCSFPTPCPPFGPPVFSGPVSQPPWYPGANGGVSFGAVPPPNPVRGHFWWDGTVFWLFDGAAWVAISGAQGTPIPPSTTPPANPFPGEQWFNGTTLFVWDGHAWVPVSGTKAYVQATAPTSPNPGDTWWDGTVLRIWDGSAWEPVGPGSVVGPVPTTTKVFQLQMSAAQLAIAAGVWAIVPFAGTPQVDTLNGWNASTHKYTPTKPGYYQFFSNFTTQPSGTGGTWGSAIVFNDSGTYQPNSQVTVGQDFISQATGTATQADFSGMIHMNGTTDFVRLWGYGSDGFFYQTSAAQPSIIGFLMP
jgi:hypothetical protein